MMLTLTNNDPQDHASYISKFHAEAMFLIMGTHNDYGYGYITFNKRKLRGFQRNSISKYNIQAWANIPIAENGTVDMRLFVGKDNNLQEFTMQYRDHVKYKGILGILNIRSDYGHGIQDPHIDVEFLDQSGKKILDEKVPQTDNFLNYEDAINAVFMQVEKYNPLIGARYWLSPAYIHPMRVDIVSELKNSLDVLTPLTILARVINVRLYEEARRGIQIDTINEFRKIAESEIKLLKEKERTQGGALDISEVRYSNEMDVLPFLFFLPVTVDPTQKAYYVFKRYASDGKENAVMPVGIVSERDEHGSEITRALNEDEKNY
jgi:hypothetical protein